MVSRSVLNKVLVSGGAGFIGSHIVGLLTEAGYEVGILDDLSTGERSNLAGIPHARFHQGDIRDSGFVERTLKENEYDAVLHQAALVSVARSVDDPLRTSAVNVDGTLNLLLAARKSKVERFVYASSSSVYGETQTLPKVETMSTQPISPYAASKLAAENYCRVFARVYGLRTVSLRYFNVYGPKQKPGPYSAVIPAFIKRVMGDEPPIIFGDGQQTRDFTFVQDAARANLLCLEKDVKPGEVFNIATGRQVTINETATMVEKLMGKPVLGLRHAPAREGDVRRSYADIGKARAALGYTPRFSFEMGLAETIKWFKGQAPDAKG
jgi:UDP-glucose 4-epimerase